MARETLRGNSAEQHIAGRNAATGALAQHAVQPGPTEYAIMAKQTPAERIADQIAIMQAKRASEDFRKESIEFGTWQTGIKLEIQQRTAQATAQAAFARRVAAARVEANASEQDKLALRRALVAKAQTTKAVQAEVNPKPDTKADPDAVLMALEAMGITLTKSQAAKLGKANG